ncbi:MAG: SURF1 family protein [Burkholderiaceae bacterium]|nr:SURF1 family protein [Burkholderiaceae bacterium]
MSRGNTKLALQAQADAAEQAQPVVLEPSIASLDSLTNLLPRRVRLSGVFDPAGTIYLDNRTLNGVAGVYVLTPLIIARELPAVLIDRGWKARDMQDRTRIEVPAPPAGTVDVEGLAVNRPSVLLELGSNPDYRIPGLWQNLDYAAYERASGRSIARFVIRQASVRQTDVRQTDIRQPDIRQQTDTRHTTAALEGAKELRREWPRPADGVDRHRGYAFQWYSLAVLIAALAIGFGWKQWTQR